MPRPARKAKEAANEQFVIGELPTLPERVDIYVGAGGRVVIPAAFRAALDLKEGDRLMAFLVDGQIQLLTPTMGIRRAQRLVAETVPAGVSLVDDLIAERRREAAAEGD